MVDLLTEILILFLNLRFTSVDIFILICFPSLKFQITSFVRVMGHEKILCNFGCDSYGRKNFDKPSCSTDTSKGKYTLVTLHVTYQKLVTRLRYGLVRCATGIWPSHQRDDTVTA